jgi:hypothetical protein
MIKPFSISESNTSSRNDSPVLFSPQSNTITQAYEKEIESVINQSILEREFNLSNRDLTGDSALFFSDAIQSAFLRGLSPSFETITISSSKLDVKGFTSLIDAVIRCCLDHEEIKLKKLVMRKDNLTKKEFGTMIAKLIMEANGSVRELDVSDSLLGTGGAHALVSATFTSVVMENVNMPVIYSIYQLMILDLSGNNIGDMGVLSICKGMASLVRRHQPINLQILRLNRNNISDHGAQCITQQLMLMISSTVNQATVKVYDHFGLTPSPHQKSYVNPTLANLNISTATASTAHSLLISPMTPAELGENTHHPHNHNMSYMKLQELDLDDNNIGATGLHSILSILPSFTSLQVLSLARCTPNFTVLEILTSILSSTTTCIDFIDMKFTERCANDTIHEVAQMRKISQTNRQGERVLERPWTNMMTRMVEGIRRRLYRNQQQQQSLLNQSMESYSLHREITDRLRIHLGALPSALYQHLRQRSADSDNEVVMNEKIDIATALDLMYSVNEVFRLPNDVQRWILNNHEFPAASDEALDEMTEDELRSWSLSKQLSSIEEEKALFGSPKHSSSNCNANGSQSPSFFIGNVAISTSTPAAANLTAERKESPTIEQMKKTSKQSPLFEEKVMMASPSISPKSSKQKDKAAADETVKVQDARATSLIPIPASITEHEPPAPTSNAPKTDDRASTTSTLSRENLPVTAAVGSATTIPTRNSSIPENTSTTAATASKFNFSNVDEQRPSSASNAPLTPSRATATGLGLGGIDILLLSPSSRLALQSLSQQQDQVLAAETRNRPKHLQLTEKTVEHTMHSVSEKIITNKMREQEILLSSSQPPSQQQQPQSAPRPSFSEISALSSYEASFASIRTGNELIDKQVLEFEKIRQEKLVSSCQ